MSRLALSAFALFAASSASLGQDAEIPPPALPYFEQAVADITLDGVPDEAIWQQVAPFDGMRVIRPDTLATPKRRSHQAAPCASVVAATTRWSTSVCCMGPG